MDLTIPLAAGGHKGLRGIEEGGFEISILGFTLFISPPSRSVTYQLHTRNPHIQPDIQEQRDFSGFSGTDMLLVYNMSYISNLFYRLYP